MDVSVIIVNYNTKELTNKCIDSLVRHTEGVSYEIIVVDNASTDGSVELFKIDKRIRFIESNLNLGFGKANNLGYKYSIGKYVFLLNSDTIILNNALKLFYEKMEECKINISCMGCLLQDEKGMKMHSYGNFPKVGTAVLSYIWGGFKYLGLKNWQMDDPNARKENPSFFLVDYITGADLFIRRCVIEECGLFDPDFFLYFEETEMEWRYRKKGYLSYIYDVPAIVHLEGKSLKKGNRKYLISFRSNMLYLKKTQPAIKVVLFKCLLILNYYNIKRKRNFNIEECKEFWNIIFL